MTTWFITGCSTGFGRELAQQVLAAGDNAVITARNTDSLTELAESYPDTALAVPLDVTNAEQIDSAVEAAQQHFGAIDVLVNNAGYGYRAAVAAGEPEAVDELLASNCVGAITATEAAVAMMRERGNAVIIGSSSIAAQLSPPGSGYYAAPKAALESTFEALRQEVAPLGIRVALVQP